MSSRRDHLFPATSIGRTQGTRLQRTPSHELLTAHPLLSPGLSPPPLVDQHSPSGGGAPRYVPYTPRQRVAPTAATTGTTIHPPSPQQHQGDATSKLQLMNLKAALQNVALDTGTVGWAILERLIGEGEAPHTAAEWTEIWEVITSGKATLLLPLEQASGHDKPTAEFIKDHIVLCEGPLRKHADIITLSGLRGILDGETLTFRSTIHPSSKLFRNLLNPTTRGSALSSLPSLPSVPSSPPSFPSPSTHPYPKYVLPAHTSSLPLPPRNTATTPPKPPLPPRPSATARPVNPTSLPPTASNNNSPRLSNPFASLFGGGHKVTPSTTIPTPQYQSHAHSPPSSLHTPDAPDSSASSITSSAHLDHHHTIEVAAFTIDRKIMKVEVGKEMNKAVKEEVRMMLSGDSEGVAVPSWVAERVHKLTKGWYPFVRQGQSPPAVKTITAPREKESVHGWDIGSGGGVYSIPEFEEGPEAVARKVQDFYADLEDELVRVGVAVEKGSGSEGEKESIIESDGGDGDGTERTIRAIMEIVERTICVVFYDRLYNQPTADDASHDEALSSRVAALNMLDLGLEHLDVHVEDADGSGDAWREVDRVVRACGAMLTQLEACHSPADKAAILVAAHKVVVDGLSKLPPIRLKSEAESKAQKRMQVSLADAPTTAKGGELATMAAMAPVVVEPSGRMADDIGAARAGSVSPIPSIVEPAGHGAEREAEALPASDIPSSLSANPPTTTTSVSSEKEPTPVSGDVLLPMIIFAVVKSNPPHLVSHLLYTQRFRNQSIGGEEAYCLINLMAVAEFLENVDLEGLGLGDGVSTADLTPIPINRSPVTAATPLAPPDGIPGSLRGRVEQQVDAIAGSANKVITGVVDSSFGILRSFLPNNPGSAAGVAPTVEGAALSSSPTSIAVKPGFGLLRRENGFSIAGIAAALPPIPGVRPRSVHGEEESGQQLLTVSRPGSVRSRSSRGKDAEESAEDEGEDEEDDSDDEESEGEEEHEGDDDVGGGDTRSIKSFESMMNAKKDKRGTGPRKTLSDRFAHISTLASLKGSPPASRRTSILPPPGGGPNRFDAQASSRPGSPITLHLAPPNQRFVECTADDLRLSEVGELLRDYRRLVEGIRAVGGFDE